VIIHGKKKDEEQRSALDNDKYYHIIRKKKMEQKHRGISELSEVGRECYVLTSIFHSIALSGPEATVAIVPRGYALSRIEIERSVNNQGSLTELITLLSYCTEFLSYRS
jgi:hypothetical protein